MKPQSVRLIIILTSSLLILGILSGCSNSQAVITISPSMDVTQAYQTVEARLTQVSLPTEAETDTPAPTETIEIITPSPASTNTPLRPTATPTDIFIEPCDRAAPGFPKIDVEIDDDTLMQPGQRFTKIWRLANSGTCTWTRQYKAVWFFGPKLGDTQAVTLPSEVPPGGSVDIVVDMIAPESPGTYQSNWKLQNTEGDMFGIGPTGNSPFWVRIIVVEPPTPTPTPTFPPLPTITPTIEPTPIPTPLPTPVIAASGQITMALEQFLNLDNGELDAEDGADLTYQEDDFGIKWLSPINGAILGVYGSNEPSKLICQDATKSSAPIAVGSLNLGTYLCYTTANGLPGWLSLNSLDEDTFVLNLSFVTWAQDEDP